MTKGNTIFNLNNILIKEYYKYVKNKIKIYSIN